MPAQTVFEIPHLRKLIFDFRFRLMIAKFCHYDTDDALFGTLPRPTQSPCARYQKIAEIAHSLVDDINPNYRENPLVQLLFLNQMGMSEHGVCLTNRLIERENTEFTRFSDFISHIVVDDPHHSLSNVSIFLFDIQLDSFTFDENSHQWSCRSFQPPYTPLYTVAMIGGSLFLKCILKDGNSFSTAEITMQRYDHFIDLPYRLSLIKNNFLLKMHNGLHIIPQKCKFYIE